MPGIEKLPIEEALDDSPQTRSLLGVFEEDTAAMSSYCTQLYRAMQRIYDAQNELSAATHLTSRLLKEYDKQVGSHGLITLDTGLITLATA
ncbi:DCC-interacting protein 13-alpha [Liparis tanakae]|uniref:DCC-interacting protein 13-alpha n=1 Tax=Liparis tanakae TaxID=230148 RepID=A0A4Z2ET79_9TELE|nr:DCC-interacting protein 13-alpha [Liparis tanakae]